MTDWKECKEVFRRAFRSSFHYSVATVGADGEPHVAPIGSVLLTGPGRGIYFDIFTSDLSDNVDRDPRVCILAVDSGKWFWFRSLLGGRFIAPPGVRLVGTAGPRRPATDEEKQRWLRRVRAVRRLRGHRLLWSDLEYVRDLEFTGSEPVRLGRMTDR